MRRLPTLLLTAALAGCGACDDLPPPPAPEVPMPPRPVEQAPSIGLDTQPQLHGPAAERRDLSSRGVPTVMLVPAGAQVLNSAFSVPGTKEESPSLVIAKDAVRLELVKAPDLDLKSWKLALAGARVELEEATDSSWSLVWQEEERLGAAVWNAGVLCVSKELTKPQLKDALKLCQSMAPSAGLPAPLGDEQEP